MGMTEPSGAVEAVGIELVNHERMAEHDLPPIEWCELTTELQRKYAARATSAIAAMPTPSDQEKRISDWQPISTCPIDEYVLLRFEGPFHDSECPGVSVGKIEPDMMVWLTAIWAGSTAHDDPIGWLPLSPERSSK